MATKRRSPKQQSGIIRAWDPDTRARKAAETILRGPRLVLRPIQPSDAQAYYENVRDPQVLKYLESAFVEFPKRFRLSDAKDYIATARKSGFQVFAITLKNTGKLIGAVELRVVTAHSWAWADGSWIAKPYQQQGYGRETLYLLEKYLFEKLKAHRLLLSNAVENDAAKKLFKSCGLTYEATLREDFKKNGKWMDAQFWSILEKEWPTAKRKIEAKLGIK